MFLSYISERQGLVWLQSALHLDPQYQPAHAALARYYRSLEPATEESQRLAERHAAAAGAALDDEAVKSPARPVTESDPE